MKVVVALALFTAVACSNEQNLGNTYTLRAPRWAISIGGAGNDSVGGVAVDPNGDVIAHGTFQGTVDFGAGPITASTDLGASFITKHAAADGAQLWTVVLGVQPQVEIDQVATAANGDVLVTGKYQGTQDFGGMSLSANADVFLARYSGDGHLVAVRGLGASSFASHPRLATGDDGRVYLSGTFDGQFSTPAGILTSASGQNGFLAAFDATGALRWAYAEPVYGALAVTSDGSLILGSIVDQTTTFGTTHISLTETPDELVASLTPEGAVVWVHPFGDVGVVHAGFHLVRDESGDMATTAMIVDQTIDTPSASLLDAAGIRQWSSSPGARAVEPAIALHDGVVVTGGTLRDARADFGRGPQNSVMYLLARNANGAVVDSRVFGDPSVGIDDSFTALAMDSTGNLVFAGNIDQPIDFGAGAVPVFGNQDLVLGYMAAPH